MRQPASPESDYFLQGPGEMRARCRELDWSKTKLGALATWPQSLRTAVQMVLASPFPNIILWGPELIQLYNDGYRELMGNKHPAGLGQPTQQCWPEVWHINQPIYQRVWAGESFSFADALFPIIRSGQLQDAWFTLAYSPVRDESGQVAGGLVTVFETTEQVLEKKHKERAQLALLQREQQFSLLVRATSEMVYSMSADWQQMLQLDGKEFLASTTAKNGNWLNEYIPPKEQERVWAAIQQAIDQKIPFEAEHQVISRDGSLGWVFSRAIPILNEAGQIVEWIGSASDITERKYAQLRQTFLLGLSDTLSPISDPVAIQEVAARLLGEQLAADRTYYAWVEGNYEVAIIEREYRRGDVPSVVGKHAFADFGSTDAAYRSGRIMILEDVEDGHSVPNSDLPAFRALGIRSLVSVPLVKQGRTVASMTVLKGQPYPWTPQEVSLVGETAERTWAAVERARAEAALRQSEEKYRTLFDSMDEGVSTLEVIFDEHDRAVDLLYLEHNQALTRLTGLPSEITGKRTSEVIPDLEAFWLESFGRAVLTGQPERVEYQIAPLDRWFDVYVSRVGGADSHTLVVLYNNITERKRREQQQAFLLQFSDTLRTLPDQQTIAQTSLQLLADYLGLDRSYIATVYRREDRAVIGPEYRRAELGLIPISGELHMTDFPEGFRQVEEHTLVVDNIATDATLSARDRQSLGAINLTALVVASVRKGERDVIWALVASTTAARQWTPDEVGLIEMVAERTWAAVERARAENALRQADERFRTLANAAPVLLWETDADGVTFTNQHYLDFFSVDPNDLRHMGWTRFLHPEDAAGYLATYQQAFVVRQPYVYECRFRRADGQYRWLFNTGRPLNAHHFVGSSIDITANKEAEELRKEADRRKDEFLAMLAHELRNPLAPVRNGLQLLAQTQPADPILGTLLPIMNRQMNHVMRMVDDLLDVSRISRGKIELYKKRIDLTQVVAQAVDAMRPLYAGSGRQLDTQLPDSPLYLDGDETRIFQVVSNLLTNGIRYTHEGGQVWLSLEGLGQQAVLRVKDNGIGLAADQLEAIFGLFVQVDTSLARSHGGLGLGLALVQQLVQLHGGRVEAHSQGLEQGSEFIVYLPLLPTQNKTSDDH